MRLFTPLLFILSIGLCCNPNHLFAQKPTLDAQGRRVKRLSKSPVDWQADNSSYGSRVAQKTVAPILSGEEDDSKQAQLFKKSIQEDWEDVLLITDYTGSMYPYAPQVLRLHLADRSSQIVRHLVLFNDGDDMSNSMKKPGQVGGIYFVDNASDEVQLLEAITDVVNNGGGGGDGKENDLEAVVSGISRYKNAADGKPSFGQVVLIADGGEAVRDMNLLEDIGFPLHIIMCRNKRYIDDYLEIALQTNGSVSYDGERAVFGEEEGVTVATIGGRTYKRVKAGDWR